MSDEMNNTQNYEEIIAHLQAALNSANEKLCCLGYEPYTQNDGAEIMENWYQAGIEKRMEQGYIPHSLFYEEKRQLRMQISQLLADAGLNQAVLKEMVEKEIDKRVQKALDQCIASLNATTSSGDYLAETMTKLARDKFMYSGVFQDVVKRELQNRCVRITLEGIEMADPNTKTDSESIHKTGRKEVY